MQRPPLERATPRSFVRHERMPTIMSLAAKFHSSVGGWSWTRSTTLRGQKKVMAEVEDNEPQYTPKDRRLSKVTRRNFGINGPDTHSTMTCTSPMDNCF